MIEQEPKNPSLVSCVVTIVLFLGVMGLISYKSKQGEWTKEKCERVTQAKECVRGGGTWHPKSENTK